MFMQVLMLSRQTSVVFVCWEDEHYYSQTLRTNYNWNDMLNVILHIRAATSSLSSLLLPYGLYKQHCAALSHAQTVKLGMNTAHWRGQGRIDLFLQGLFKNPGGFANSAKCSNVSSTVYWLKPHSISSTLRLNQSRTKVIYVTLKTSFFFHSFMNLWAE